MVSFENTDVAVDWLSEQPEWVHCALAMRVALRALPNLVLLEPVAVEKLALPIMRSLIVGVVATGTYGAQIRELADYVADGLAEQYTRFSKDSGHSLDAKNCVRPTHTALKTMDPRIDLEDRLGNLSYLVVGHGPTKSTDATTAAELDGASYERFDQSTSIFDAALWPGEGMPLEIAQRLENLKQFWRKNPEIWSFWERWYQAIVYGDPISEDLQLAIAQLPDEDWKKGPEWIAKRITEIEARTALKQRIQELQEALISERRDRRGIGGNYPPEQIETLNDVPPELVVIWEPLTQLEREIQSAEPDIGSVKRAINGLAAIAVGCGAWTWEKANMFLDAALKSAGVATGTAAVAFATGHGDKIVGVINAALDWVKLLP